MGVVVTELLLRVVDDALFAAIPAVGFAMLFNVPPRLLKFCALAGALAHACRLVLIEIGLSIELASFCVALLIGTLAIYWSRRKAVPQQCFTVPAVIPMIPGKYIFGAMVGLVKVNLGEEASPELLMLTAQNALKGTAILGALAAGVALPQMIMNRRKPVV